MKREVLPEDIETVIEEMAEEKYHGKRFKDCPILRYQRKYSMREHYEERRKALQEKNE